MKKILQSFPYLRSLEFDALSAQDMQDLEEVRSELIRFGYLSLAPKEKLRRSDPLERPRRFLSQNGYTILAGRNSRQNDVLTMRIAQEEDYWFHAKNIPGSHVILFTRGTQPPEADMLQAAIIAASLCRVKTVVNCQSIMCNGNISGKPMAQNLAWYCMIITVP